MGNANNKMSRSCVPGSNNNNNNKAQTGTMDERIDALVLRLHEVPPFLFLSFSFSFERAAFLSARRRPFSPTREFEKCKPKNSLFLRLLLLLLLLLIRLAILFVCARLSTVEEEGGDGEGEKRR